MTYSFDIFDTCLVRTCGSPFGVFDLLAKEILGVDALGAAIADFRYVRMKGEQDARKKTTFEEVTIEEIYDCCDFSGLTAYRKEFIQKKELEIEEHVLRPVFKIRKKIEALRLKGHQIIFISDIYLPLSFISKILYKYDIAKAEERIFLSSEYRKTKCVGSLFDTVRKELHIKPFTWHHCGDNWHSDFLKPISKLIFAHHIGNNYTYYQKMLKSKDVCLTESPLAVCSGISRSLILNNASNIYIKVAADLLAPLYVSFVFDVLSDSSRKGINKLFFLSRDGYILYVLAQQFSTLFPQIEVKYFHTSRKALYLPSLAGINKESIKRILNKFGNKTPESLFDNLQLSVDAKDFDVKHPENIIDNPRMKERLYSIWKEQQENCIGYFKQEGLASNKPDVAIVDIRGTRKCQEAISGILERNGYCRVFAYYLEADELRIFPTHKDEYKALCYGDYIRYSNLHNMEASKVFFERYFCMNNFARTVGYEKTLDGHYQPKYDNNIAANPLCDIIKKINEDVCNEFCKLFIEHKLYMYSSVIGQNALAVLSEFTSHPKKEYLKVFEGLDFAETENEKTPILPSIMDVVKGKRPIWISGFFKHNFNWLAPLGIILFRVLILVRRFFDINNKSIR